MKTFYQLAVMPKSADLYIYGDITSTPLFESDVSATPLVQQIDALDVEEINVYINSYGGEVKEAVAICSALQRNRAKIITYNDSFACSAAADIFMAGDERIMSSASVLFIHRAWMGAVGNYSELMDAAESIKTIDDASRKLYSGKLKISDDELEKIFVGATGDGTWLSPEGAVSMGFATGIVEEKMQMAASQSVKYAIFQAMTQKPQQKYDFAMDAETLGNALMNAMQQMFNNHDKPPDDESQELQEPPEGKEQQNTDMRQLFQGLLLC